jgi:hypothetical protein
MPRRDYDSDLEPRPRRRPRGARGGSDSKTVLILVCVGVGLLFLVGAVAIGVFVLQGSGGKKDLERLQGSWESTFRDPAGNVAMHKVKVIDGNTETATWYDANGNKFRVNQVQFDLRTDGGSKRFRYFNGRVLFGPDAGMPFPSGEYVYTLDGDTWTEYVAPTGTIVWTRRR